MPLYEYVCLDCGTRFDVLRKMSESDKPIPCKTCEGDRTLRQISVFYAQSGGRVVAGNNSGGGCAGCSGGSCAGCSH